MRITLAPLALAAILPLSALPIPARAETIAKERFGCHTQAVTDRLFKMVMADDEEGFGQLLRVSLASGECRMWKPGETVRLETRTGGFGCLAPEDAAVACYWTSIGAIEKAD